MQETVLMQSGSIKLTEQTEDGETSYKLEYPDHLYNLTTSYIQTWPDAEANYERRVQESEQAA